MPMGSGELKDLTILVTGATGDIGRATALALAAVGARVWIHGRDPGRVEALRARLSAAGASLVRTFVADFSSLRDVAALARNAAAVGDPLDVLINNAGVGFGKDAGRRETSRDGFELRFAVNYLAPFLLTEELLARGAPRRAVINVASAGQEDLDFDDLMSESGYAGVQAYRRSKLALVMMSFGHAEAHPDLQVHALHPGTYLDTQMVRDAGMSPMGPASQGVDSILGVLDAALRGGRSGRYFDQTRPTRALAQAYDPRARGRLREESLRLVAPFR